MKRENLKLNWNKRNWMNRKKIRQNMTPETVNYPFYSEIGW